MTFIIFRPDASERHERINARNRRNHRIMESMLRDALHDLEYMTLAERAFAKLDRRAHSNCRAFIDFYDTYAADGYTYDEQSWCDYYPFEDGSVLEVRNGEWIFSDY